MKRFVIVAVLSLLAGVASMAQNVKRPESYNYQRGLEAVQNEKVDEALEYFNKDIQENPKNGYSYSWIAMLQVHQEEYGQALTAVEMALKLLPKKDEEYVVFAYSTRAGIYLNLEDTVKAVSDLTTALMIMPDQSSLYEKRAQIYYEQEKYNMSDADYQKMIDLEPGETMGYMGIGRNANAQKCWDDAIKQFDYVTKLSSDYSSVYSFRAESYIGKEKWSEATDDIVTALSLDWDMQAARLAIELEEPAFTMLVSKLKIQSAKSLNEATWPCMIGIMYEQKKEYEKAVEYYNIANNKEVSPLTYYSISACQYKLGNYEAALSSINQALDIDSTYIPSMEEKAEILYEMGDVRSAIAEWDKVLAAQPEYGFGYYRRGWFKDLAGDMDGAIEDLSISVVLDSEYSYAYVCRGDIYQKQGKQELAESDFRKVIEIEDSPEKYDCIYYAYQGLGQYDEAIAAMDSIIARDSTEARNYYDAACLYSRMQDKDNALKYLEKSLHLGYKRFAHIERDYDMDFIRETDEFKALIQKYKPEGRTEGYGGDAASSKSEVQTIEIPFVKEDGVCKVKCQINDLPLHFVFDTGASDVTLSMVEATFMMKNGYLSGSDVVGSQRYMDANGDVSVGTVINLKNVNLGGLKLNNVRASVVRNQKAPLLMGQSILGRLGKIEIDNANRLLKITQSK